MTTLGFGKHADTPIEQVPEDYLFWLIKNSQDKLDICNAELDRRQGKIDNSVMAQIVKLGCAEIKKQLPPDEHVKATKAHDALMKAIIEAAQGPKP